jgi:hypothetical protein
VIAERVAARLERSRMLVDGALQRHPVASVAPLYPRRYSLELFAHPRRVLGRGL